MGSRREQQEVEDWEIEAALASANLEADDGVESSHSTNYLPRRIRWKPKYLAEVQARQRWERYFWVMAVLAVLWGGVVAIGVLRWCGW